MTPPNDVPPDAPPLTRAAMVLRLGVIGAVVAAFALAFAWAAGWLTPERLTQAKIVDAFERDNGVHAGFRRNHAKGVCLSGWFDSNGAAARLSRADVFRAGRSEVSGRFALAGGQPYAADAARTVRSMALRIVSPGGEEWRSGMNDIPVFVVRTPEAFYAQLLASRPDPKTGKPDPAAMPAFLASHPETARAIAAIKAHPKSSGFGDDAYYGLDAFRFVDANDNAHAVRWAMQPLQPFAPAADGEGTDKNALFDALIAEVSRAPLRWRLVVTVAAPGDATDDATIAWPSDREQVDAGTLTIDRIESEDSGSCRDIVFDPLVLPDGIEASDDPLLSARSAAYAQSFRRRAGEDTSPSAVAASTEAKR